LAVSGFAMAAPQRGALFLGAPMPFLLGSALFCDARSPRLSSFSHGCNWSNAADPRLDLGFHRSALGFIRKTDLTPRPIFVVEQIVTTFRDHD
jgi:hypothetical protein